MIIYTLAQGGKMLTFGRPGVMNFKIKVENLMDIIATYSEFHNLARGLRGHYNHAIFLTCVGEEKILKIWLFPIF